MEAVYLTFSVNITLNSTSPNQHFLLLLMKNIICSYSVFFKMFLLLQIFYFIFNHFSFLFSFFFRKKTNKAAHKMGNISARWQRIELICIKIVDKRFPFLKKKHYYHLWLWKMVVIFQHMTCLELCDILGLEGFVFIWICRITWSGLSVKSQIAGYLVHFSLDVVFGKLPFYWTEMCSQLKLRCVRCYHSWVWSITWLNYKTECPAACTLAGHL